MQLSPPLPGLHNVLTSSTKLSYLSTTAHTLHPGACRAPVLVHAADGDLLAHAATHVILESPSLRIRLSPALHFRPTDLALHATPRSARLVIAGPDGAFFATLDLLPGEHRLHSLPGSAGYHTVAVAVDPHVIAAAAIDGRVALWRAPHHPASRVIDIPPLPSDRVTDLAFAPAGLLIAWWSGRLLLHALGKRDSQVQWDMRISTVDKHVFGQFPGSYLARRHSVIAFVTGRGDLAFVRLADGAHCITKVGEYVKGLCDHAGKLHLVVDGALVTREWITNAELDRKCVHVPKQPSIDAYETTETPPLETG